MSCALTGLKANSITGTCVNSSLVNATACTCPEPEFALAKIFINVNELPAGAAGFIQLLWLFIFYGLVLFQGSNMISDGSELLFLLPEYLSPALVGSVVLPVLGAVPDGAIVLFSGFGPDAQEQLNVGIGALAGSTIMLLTVPWFLAILAGRVDVDTRGAPVYRSLKKTGSRRLTVGPAPGGKSKMWDGSGVAPKAADMQLSGKMMLGTACIYLIIQIPAFVFVGRHEADETIAQNEKYWALVGLIVAIGAFGAYLWAQVRQAGQQDQHEKVAALTAREIAAGNASIAAFIFDDAAAASPYKSSTGVGNAQLAQPLMGADGKSAQGDDAPLPLATEKVLRETFKRYDDSGDGTLSRAEVAHLLRDLGMRPTKQELGKAFDMLDCNHDNEIEYVEFRRCIRPVVRAFLNGGEAATMEEDIDMKIAGAEAAEEEDEEQEEEEEEEEEMPEVPEDLAGIDDKATLQRRVLQRSLYQMLVGTILVLLFSDPMVDVFAELGNRTGIPAFYVSFVLAPLASNASELISAYNYAQKKTTATITTSLATLQGAACMNNTFCLGIFLMLIYAKGLYWEFSAETISIVMVQVAVAVISFRRHQYMREAWAILSLYPVSILLVWILENPCGLK